MFVPIKNVHLVGITNDLHWYKNERIEQLWNEYNSFVLITKFSPPLCYEPFSWLVITQYSKMKNVNCFDMLLML